MRMIAILAFVLVAGCATPEQKLLTGYQTASKVVTTATILLDRDQLSPDEGERVLKAGQLSKTALDSGKLALAQCRSQTPDAKCTGAVANINLGSGISMQLEKFLEAQQ